MPAAPKARQPGKGTKSQRQASGAGRAGREPHTHVPQQKPAVVPREVAMAMFPRRDRAGNRK